jgi:hypothetical protein
MVENNRKERNHEGAGDSAAGYEEKDINLKSVFLVAGGVVVVIVIVVIVLNEFFIISKEEIIRRQVLAPESVALRELRAQEEELLGSYGVVDSEKGVYRVPIERAMRLLAEEAYQNREAER